MTFSERGPRPEMRDSSPESSRRKKLLAAGAGLAAVLGVWQTRLEGTESQQLESVEATQQTKELRKKTFELLRALGENAQKIPQAEQEPSETHALDLRNEDLLSFPNKDLPQIGRFANIDKIVSRQLEIEPDLRQRYAEAVKNLKIETDDSAVVVYLPEDPDFNLTNTLDLETQQLSYSANQEQTKAMVSSLMYGGDGPEPTDKFREIIRQDLEGKVLDYLQSQDYAMVSNPFEKK